MDSGRPFPSMLRAMPTRCRGAAQSMTLWLFIVLGIVLLAAALSSTSVRDLLGSKADPAPAPAVMPAVAPASSAPSGGKDSGPPGEFGLDQLRDVFSVLGESERARVLNDATAFSDLVRNERARWSVVQAAREAGLESSPQVVYLMQRSAEQVLVDTYVKLNVGAAVPASYPSEDQIRRFYEQDPSRYRVEARIPVWQIFLAIPESANAAQIAQIERRAKDLASGLRSGKLDFARAAGEYSAHQASRLNGGFMGNLKIDELIPEVKSAVTGAPVGKILDPVRSAAGLHILKRGEQIDATQLSLEQVQDQIKTVLRQAAEKKARQVLVSRAREKAGAEPGGEQLEKWRAALSAPASGGAP